MDVHSNSATNSSFTQSDHEDEGADHNSNPYGFLEQDYSFGVKGKGGGAFLPKSDFSIKLLYFVEAGHLTGYVCSVTRELDQITRYAQYYGSIRI